MQRDYVEVIGVNQHCVNSFKGFNIINVFIKNGQRGLNIQLRSTAITVIINYIESADLFVNLNVPF